MWWGWTNVNTRSIFWVDSKTSLINAKLYSIFSNFIQHSGCLHVQCETSCDSRPREKLNIVPCPVHPIHLTENNWKRSDFQWGRLTPGHENRLYKIYWCSSLLTSDTSFWIAFSAENSPDTIRVRCQLMIMHHQRSAYAQGTYVSSWSAIKRE